jgi:hypothetical protein
MQDNKIIHKLKFLEHLRRVHINARKRVSEKYTKFRSPKEISNFSPRVISVRQIHFVSCFMWVSNLVSDIKGSA